MCGLLVRYKHVLIRSVVRSRIGVVIGLTLISTTRLQVIVLDRGIDSKSSESRWRRASQLPRRASQDGLVHLRSKQLIALLMNDIVLSVSPIEQRCLMDVYLFDFLLRYITVWLLLLVRLLEWLVLYIQIILILWRDWHLCVWVRVLIDVHRALLVIRDGTAVVILIGLLIWLQDAVASNRSDLRLVVQT